MKQSITVEELETLIEFDTPLAIYDVRKRPAFDDDNVIITGAEYCDPAAKDVWLDKAPKDRLIVCYCVHGHAVSQGARSALADKGRRAVYLRGGIDAWKHASGALTAKP